MIFSNHACTHCVFGPSTLPLNSRRRTGTNHVSCGLLICTAGRSDLVHSINRCGGSKRLAAVLGLHFTETRGRKAQTATGPEALPIHTDAQQRRRSYASVHSADFVWV